MYQRFQLDGLFGCIVTGENDRGNGLDRSVVCPKTDGVISWRKTGRHDLHLEFRRIERDCVDLKRRDVAFGPGLKPDGLPDPRAGGIPAHLLARGEFGIGRVKRSNNHHVVALAIRDVGNIRFDRRISSFVFGDLLTIYPNVGTPVDRVQSKPDPLFGGNILGDREMPAIPAHLGRPCDLVDARQLAFPGKWHQDCAVVSRCPGLLPTGGNTRILGIKSEFPTAIEAGPIWTSCIGSRVLGRGMAASSASAIPHVISPPRTTKTAFERIMMLAPAI